jgi:tetratricopeptide (TPR) repeat protein
LSRYFLFLILVLGLSGCGPAAESFNQKGAEAYHRGDLSGAKKQFRRALFLNGSNPAYHNNLGYVLYQLKDYDRAETEFFEALAGHPNENLLKQIRIDQALLYCDANAVLADPSHKNWNGKGMEVLKLLLVKDPDNAELHMRLGFAYFRAANPGGGFSELDQAAQWATPSQTSRYTSNAVESSLYVLRQIQQFYVKARLFKKAESLQRKIQLLEKKKPPLSIHH